MSRVYLNDIISKGLVKEGLSKERRIDCNWHVINTPIEPFFHLFLTSGIRHTP